MPFDSDIVLSLLERAGRQSLRMAWNVYITRISGDVLSVCTWEWRRHPSKQKCQNCAAYQAQTSHSGCGSVKNCGEVKVSHCRAPQCLNWHWMLASFQFHVIISVSCELRDSKSPYLLYATHAALCSTVKWGQIALFMPCQTVLFILAVWKQPPSSGLKCIIDLIF